MIDHYDWAGGREAMLRFGDRARPGRVVVMLPALFEEHNRTRGFTVAICRGLAALGVASLLPDLPGQNESPLATDDVTLDDWRGAVAALVETVGTSGPVHLAAIRGGAILDGAPGSVSVWRLAPIAGRAVLRDLHRAALVDGKPPAMAPDTGAGPATLAGNSIGGSLRSALMADDVLTTPPAPVRTVQLEADTGDADVTLPGAPLWRRAEPGNDPTLAQMIAADIAAWIVRCEG